MERPRKETPHEPASPRKQAEVYDRWLQQGGDYDKEATERGWHVPEIVFKKLEPELQPGQKLIDFGAGSGLSAEPFQKAGLEMRGVDGSNELLKIADRKGVYSLGTQCALIGQDVIEANHDYDYAISLGTTNIIPRSRGTLLTEMQQAVKPGGIVAFNYLDPADYNDVTIVQTKEGDLVDQSSLEQQHRFFHRPEDILKTCEELDLVPISEHEAISYPNREPGKQNPTRIMFARYDPKV